jgi:hypothetical protein
LIVQRNPAASIDGLFADPNVAWTRFDSELVVNTREPQERLMRHRDLHWIWDKQDFKTPKYVVKPDRCPDQARWWLHDVYGAPGYDVAPDDFTVAHFFALSTGWGGKDDRARKHIPTPQTHYEDTQLRDTLHRVFRDGVADLAMPTTAHVGNPHLLRRDAYALKRAGDNSAALARLNQAIAIDPYHPVQHQIRKEFLEDFPPPEH